MVVRQEGKIVRQVMWKQTKGLPETGDYYTFLQRETDFKLQTFFQIKKKTCLADQSIGGPVCLIKLPVVPITYTLF